MIDGQGHMLPETFVEGFHTEAVVRRMRFRKCHNYGLLSVMGLGASGLGGMFTKGQGSGLASATAQDDTQKDLNRVAPAADANAQNDGWFAEDSVADKEAAKEIVLTALKAGVNIIDTAHWYGQGRSERMLGYALDGVPRKAYYITSKVCRYEKDPRYMFDFTFERTYQAGLDTLKRLRLTYVDCFQVHDPEFAPSVEMLLAETLPALRKLQAEGKCRFVGITGYPLELQRQLLARCDPLPESSLSYCHYTMHDTSLVSSGYVELCASKGVALLNASPLSMGLLTPDGPPDWHPATAETKAACKAAADYCSGQGVNIAKLAINFTLSYEPIATTFIGAATLGQLQANLDAACSTLSDKEQEVLQHIRNSIFLPNDPRSWEGVELAAYRKSTGASVAG
mmetsp:Transcript_24359/g.53189  ORF Transcript_24359/g.53189 Transcript_24359/m.53189 type:complete len:397 (-) Transcript_24359:260-1450(-)